MEWVSRVMPRKVKDWARPSNLYYAMGTLRLPNTLNFSKSEGGLQSPSISRKS